VLVDHGDLDPLLALSYIVDPPDWMAGSASPRRRPFEPDELTKARRLAAAGFTHRAIGKELGRPRSTISAALPGGRQLER
jgi:hypothetical protein